MNIIDENIFWYCGLSSAGEELWTFWRHFWKCDFKSCKLSTIVFIFVLFHILCIFPEFDCPNSFHFNWTKFSSLLQCLGNIHCSWHVCIQMNIWCPFWWSHWLHLFGIGFQQHSLHYVQFVKYIFPRNRTSSDIS